MNNKIALLSGVVLATLTGATVVPVSAAQVSATTSHNTVTFLAGDGETKPVDPTNPDHPVDPNHPIDPDDPDNNGTGNKGPLSLDYVTNFNFGTHKISGQSQSYAAKNKNAFIQVTDTRGTGGGWTLKATSDDFKDAKGNVLKGATISLGKGNLVSTGSSMAPTSLATTLVPNESTKVLTAKKDAGEGTWVDQLFKNSGSYNEKDENKEDLGTNSVVKLNVVGGTAKATSYTNNVKWSLEDAPEA